MNPRARYKPSKDFTPACVELMTMAERELSAFFNAVTQLFGSEQAELSAEDWLQELIEIDDLPTSVPKWRLITAKVSTRLAAEYALRPYRKLLRREKDMRVFVTGATGFIGSAIVRELIDAGHQVLGLARSDEAAKSLLAAGADIHRGSLDDLESLRSGTAAADGVIHTAFIHDFSNYGPAAEADRRAIETLGNALAGSDRPLIVTSGTLLAQRQGPLATEEDAHNPNFPRKSEDAALALAGRGVRASVLRLPPSVHGSGDHGFVPRLISIAREKGVSAFIGDGLNRWPAVHRLDAAHLYRLVLEKSNAGVTYHGVADEDIPTRKIAEAIGRGLNVPVVSKRSEEAADHFGWTARFFGIDGPASSAQTQQRLGWKPVHPGLIADLNEEHYFEHAGDAVALRG